MSSVYNANSGVYLDYGYLMLPANIRVVSLVTVHGNIYHSKANYHVSLLCLEHLSDERQHQILAFAKNYPVKLGMITAIFRTAARDGRKSVIVRVNVDGLNDLIEAINTHFEYNFSYPPTHITLFIPENQEGGVAINTDEEYELFTEGVNGEATIRLRESFSLLS